MKTITAVILTRNEENMIADCLDSVSFCNEIIVIDSESTDSTVALAKRMGAKIIEDTSNDFSEKRNIGLEKAKSDFILYVDADERVNEALKDSLLKEVASETAKDAYKVTRINYYLGEYKWPRPETFLRFFKRKSLLLWEGSLHETAKVKGEIGELNGSLVHYTHRDLSSMVKKTMEWSDIEARLRFDANHPKMTWWRFPRVMLSAFIQSYIREEGWRVGTAGVIESIYQSFSIFITYAKLWEMQQEKKKE